MAILDFKQIKQHAGARPAHVDVKVEAWGGSVRLAADGRGGRRGAGPAVPELWKRTSRVSGPDEDLVEFYVLLLANSIVSDHGERELLTAEGKEFLKEQDLGVLTQLGQAALKLNGFVDDEAVESAKKNSRKAPTGSSASASAEP